MIKTTSDLMNHCYIFYLSILTVLTIESPLSVKALGTVVSIGNEV